MRWASLRSTLGRNNPQVPTDQPRLTLDFGREVAGNISLVVTATSSPPPDLYAAFSESELFMSPDGSVGPSGDQSKSTASLESSLGPANPYTLPYDYEIHRLTVPPVVNGPETVTDPNLRGGFRYLALFLKDAGSISFNSVSVNFTAAPLQQDLRAYQGWFLSSNDTLNKLWYSGAYTIQLDTIDPKTGECPPVQPLTPDSNNALIGVGNSLLVDGAKRDRLAWGYSNFEDTVPYVTTQDYVSTQNNVITRLDGQIPGSDAGTSGHVPATTPWCEGTVSAEYPTFLELDAGTVESIYDNVLYGGDLAFAQKYYPNVQAEESYLLSHIDSTGLLYDNVLGCLHNIGYAECAHTSYGSVLVYRSLVAGAELAALEGNAADQATWTQDAAALKNAINQQLWDPVRGAYVQSLESYGVISQEGTGNAIYSGLATPAMAIRALAYLKTANWNAYGSAIWDRDGGGMVSGADPSIKWAKYDEPAPSYFELASRIANQDGQDAITLMTNYWGHMIADDSRYPGSPPLTMWERMSVAGLPTLETNFPAALVSQAHNWGAGPTVALTTQVVGVQPTTPGYAQFTVQPHTLGLTWAQGQVPTPHGPIYVAFDAGKTTAGQFTLNVNVPTGTAATVSVPLLGAQRTIYVDGKAKQPSSSDGYYDTYTAVAPGSHTFSYSGLGAASSETCTTAASQGWPVGTTAQATSVAPPRVLVPDDTTTFDAANAIDGNPASEWAAGSPAPATLTVQLPHPQTTNGLLFYLGTEGPPGQLDVIVNPGAHAQQYTVAGKAEVELPFSAPVQLSSFQVTASDPRPDAFFNANRVRIFEVEPLGNTTALPLAATLGLTKSATSGPACAPSWTPGSPPPVATFYFHAATSTGTVAASPQPDLMDASPPTAHSSGLPSQYTTLNAAPTANQTAAAATHLRWMSPAMTQAGLVPAGQDAELSQFAATVYLLTSWPGYEASGATLHIDVYRVAATGELTALGTSQALVPTNTINGVAPVITSTPLTGELAPTDRLLADVYLTGTSSSIEYAAYDDTAEPSNVAISYTLVTPPPTSIPEASSAVGLPLVAGVAMIVLVSIRRRRRRGMLGVRPS